MILKGLVDEDFVNYKKPSMFVIFPRCSFKCDHENGTQDCQNWCLVKEPDINVSVDSVVGRYTSNGITKAIVCGGLEPMDSFDDVVELVTAVRSRGIMDDFVIYTGYNKEEVQDKIRILANFKNIIIKYGRFRPGQKHHFDEVLGVELASDNQYSEKL